MKRLLIVTLTILSLTGYSQQVDSILLKQKWKDIFAKNAPYDDEKFKMKGKGFDVKYTKGAFYEGLVVYQRFGFKSVECKVMFNSLADLCNPAVPLTLQHPKKPNETYNIYKSKVEVFVFDGYVFRQPLYSYEKNSGSTATWGMVNMHGPITAFKTFKYGTDNAYYIDYTIVLKDGMLVGRDPNDGEAIRFKSRHKTLFKDNPEMVAKVESEAPGYTRMDALKMYTEYNEWVKNSDPARYEAIVYPKPYREKRWNEKD